MLKIQEFISCFNSIEEANVYLEKELSLVIGEDYLHNPRERSKIYIYNKSRRSDMDSPLVREANGLILDESHALIAKGPDHHYTVNGIDNLPKNFKLYKSSAEEMTTGMMITVFNYNSVWVVASKDSISDVDYTIDVKRAVGKGIDSWWTSVFDDGGKDHIYVFDFISKEYENIWPCPTFKLYLLTIIDKKTGEELDPFVIDGISRNLGFARTKHKIISGKRSLSSFRSDVRMPSRGVILSNNNVRIKIPNSLYYSIKIADEIEDRIEPIHVAKIFLACKDDIDLMVISKSFPKYADFLTLFNRTIQKVLRDLVVMWTSVQQFTNDPVRFARAIPPYPLSQLLFMYRDKKISTFKEGIKKLSPHRLINITKGKYGKEFDTNVRHLKIKHAYENQTLSY